MSAHNSTTFSSLEVMFGRVLSLSSLVCSCRGCTYRYSPLSLPDLNYRLDFDQIVGNETLGMEAVQKLIDSEDWETLARGDELNMELRSGEILSDFQTGHCSWPPTYKVEKDEVRGRPAWRFCFWVHSSHLALTLACRSNLSTKGMRLGF